MLTGARRAAIVLLLLLCTQISAAQSTGTSFDYAAFAKAFDGQCDGPEILMFAGGGDNPGDPTQDYSLALECAKACLDKPFYPLSGGTTQSWFGFEVAGFIVSPAANSDYGRCLCESSASSQCTQSIEDAFDRYDFTCSPDNPLPCSFNGCTFLKGSNATDVARTCGVNEDSACSATTDAGDATMAALALDGDGATHVHTTCNDASKSWWWRVDLGREVSIDRVRVLHRMDGSYELRQMDGAQVRVGNSDSFNGNPTCATFGESAVIDVPCVTRGRYVYIVHWCLQLAEVEVFQNGGRLTRIGSCGTQNGTQSGTRLYLNSGFRPGSHSKGLTSLHPDVFQGMALTEIFLNGNRLGELPDGLFEGLYNLQNLYLRCDPDWNCMSHEDNEDLACVPIESGALSSLTLYYGPSVVCPCTAGSARDMASFQPYSNFVPLYKDKDCCRHSNALDAGTAANGSLAQCEDRCRELNSCRFLSYSSSLQECQVCSKCDPSDAAGAGATFTSYERLAPCVDCSAGTWAAQKRTRRCLSTTGPSCDVYFDKHELDPVANRSLFVRVQVKTSNFGSDDKYISSVRVGPTTTAPYVLGPFLKHGGDDAKCHEMLKVVDELVPVGAVQPNGSLTVTVEASAAVTNVVGQGNLCSGLDGRQYLLDAVVTVYYGSCHQCPANSLSGAGSTDRTDCLCNKGFSGNHGGPCTECAAGMYNAESGSATCTSCPLEKTSVIGSTSLSDCTCPAGKYDDDPGGNSDSGCQSCPTHTYAFAESIGLASCFCNMGYTGPNGGPCTACRPGFYKPVTSAGNRPCRTCPKWSESSAASVACRCMPGFTGPLNGPCTKCDAGTYKATAGSSLCTSCPPRSYSSTASTECSCNSGRYRDFANLPATTFAEIYHSKDCCHGGVGHSATSLADCQEACLADTTCRYLSFSATSTPNCRLCSACNPAGSPTYASYERIAPCATCSDSSYASTVGGPLLCTSSPGFLAQFYNYSQTLDYGSSAVFDVYAIEKTTPEEAHWRMWGTHSCAQMQDQYHSCTDTTSSRNSVDLHVIVMAKCPVTCSTARNSAPLYEYPALSLDYASAADWPAAPSGSPPLAARWTGFVHVNSSGQYTFRVEFSGAADEQVHLWINHAAATLNQVAAGQKETAATTFAAGFHALTLHYVNGGSSTGTPTLKLAYSGPDTGGVMQSVNGHRSTNDEPSRAPTCRVTFSSLRRSDFSSGRIRMSIEVANSDFSDADEDVTVKVDDPSGSAMITVGSGFKHAGGGDDAKCAQMAKVLDRVVDPSYISEDGDLTIVLEASATVDAHPCTEAYYYLYATVTLYMAECLPCPQFAGSAANDHASCTCGLGYMGPSVGPCRLSFYLVDLAITVPMMEHEFDGNKQDLLKGSVKHVAANGLSYADISLSMQTISVPNRVLVRDVHTRVDVQLKAETLALASAMVATLTEANINADLASDGGSFDVTLLNVTYRQTPGGTQPVYRDWPDSRYDAPGWERFSRACDCDSDVQAQAAARGSTPLCLCVRF